MSRQRVERCRTEPRACTVVHYTTVTLLVTVSGGGVRGGRERFVRRDASAGPARTGTIEAIPRHFIYDSAPPPTTPPPPPDPIVLSAVPLSAIPFLDRGVHDDFEPFPRFAHVPRARRKGTRAGKIPSTPLMKFSFYSFPHTLRQQQNATVTRRHVARNTTLAAANPSSSESAPFRPPHLLT